MKSKIINALLNWGPVTFLLAGLSYSVLALTLTPKSAYATSCNCSSEQQTAQLWCQRHYGNPNLFTFNCPYTLNGNPNYIYFTCDQAPRSLGFFHVSEANRVLNCNWI